MERLSLVASSLSASGPKAGEPAKTPAGKPQSRQARSFRKFWLANALAALAAIAACLPKARLP